MSKAKGKIPNKCQNQNKKKFDFEERTVKFGEAIIEFAKNLPRSIINNELIPLAFVIYALTFCMFVSCCGYSTRSLLPDYMQKVHIKLFENRTLKAGIDEIATSSVIDAFRSASNLRIVDENSADIVIEGKVSNFSKDPYTYTSGQTILEYKITVSFSIRCVDRVKNEVFWEGSVSDWATYETDEDAAVSEAIKKTAERLVNTVLTNW